MSGNKKPTEIRACKAIIKKIYDNQDMVWYFEKFLHADALGVANYHETVEEPMDLCTVRYRLFSGYYQTGDDFAKDVRLIVHNATLFPNSGPYYEMGKELQIIFEELYKKAKDDPNPMLMDVFDTESSEVSGSESTISDEGTPSSGGTPASEETPSSEGTLSSEGTPSSEGIPSSEGTPSSDMDPSAEVTPSGGNLNSESSQE